MGGSVRGEEKKEKYEKGKKQETDYMWKEKERWQKMESKKIQYLQKVVK